MRIEVRFNKKIEREIPADPIAIARKLKKQSSYNNSTAREAHTEWRRGRRRVGRKWLHSMHDVHNEADNVLD